MAAATAFPEAYGWIHTNATHFNIINMSIEAWQHSSNGIGWIFACFAILYLVPTIIYLRSQNMVASAMGLLLITGFMHYYGLISIYLWLPTYIIIALFTALGLAQAYRTKGAQ